MIDPDRVPKTACQLRGLAVSVRPSEVPTNGRGTANSETSTLAETAADVRRADA